jgi:zinc/manganese transport system permease protein
MTLIDLLRHDFVRNAFLAGSLVALLSGLIGYFVVLRGQAFASEALSHVGFAGAAGAALLGVSTLVGMMAFTLLGAIGMGALGSRLRGRDVEVGMVLAFTLGLGVLFLNLYTGSATAAVNLLFGSILSVTNADVWILAISSLLSLVTLSVLFRPLWFVSVEPQVAEARGVPVHGLSILFMILLAFGISEAMTVVGVLLVFALLVIPAAAAERLTCRPGLAIGLAVSISLLSIWGGLALAFVGHWPASFFIVALTCLFFVVAGMIRKLPSSFHVARAVGKPRSG